MTSHPRKMISPSKSQSSETTPRDSVSIVEDETSENVTPLDQDLTIEKAKTRTSARNDVEAGIFPALNTTVSRATTVSKKRAYTLMILVVLTQGVQMFAYGAGIVGSLTVGHAVGASDTLSTWIAASYLLTQGSFVLISGRLGTVYGHKRIMTLGSAVWVFWVLATAYGRNIVSISFMRALAGIGGGLLVPNAVAILTTTFPPGKERNLALALFASMGPVGGAGGCTIDGILFEWVDWTWLFFFLYERPFYNIAYNHNCKLWRLTFDNRAVLGAVIYGAAIIIVPGDERLDPDGTIDWVGAYLGVAGLVLFNFVWK